MRAAVVAIGLVVVGCSSSSSSSSSSGSTAPDACESALRGTWTVTDTKTANDARCSGAPERADFTVSIDSAWREADSEGTTAEFQIDGMTTLRDDGVCAVFTAERTSEKPDGTQVTSRVLSFDKGQGTITGETTVTLYASDDFAARGESASVLCRVVYDTKASR